MVEEPETCWSLIRGAALGREGDQATFASRYMPTVRAYLTARWRNSSLSSEIEDVVQEVFIACLREGGVLEGANPEHPSGFRALLFSVTRNIALRAEGNRGRRARQDPGSPVELDRTPNDDPSLSRIFDREYARAIMVEARLEMGRRAAAEGPWAVRRVELLRLRFVEDQPIRAIAKLWQEDPKPVDRVRRPSCSLRRRRSEPSSSSPA